jgi:hypothetical protein
VLLCSLKPHNHCNITKLVVTGSHIAVRQLCTGSLQIACIELLLTSPRRIRLTFYPRSQSRVVTATKKLAQVTTGLLIAPG